MIYIKDEVVIGDERIEVELVSNDDKRDYRLTVNRPEIGITSISGTFGGAKILSAHLRDEVGLGPAADLLEKHGIPRTHPLWDLNHSGLQETK